MGQVSKYLRSVSSGYAHWCLGCEEMHVCPSTWTFNGNLDCPTFTPSFKHGGYQRKFVDGKWAGEWLMDENGNPIPFVCHYILTNGIVNFCSDSSHKLSGKSVRLPELPDFYKEGD